MQKNVNKSVVNRQTFVCSAIVSTLLVSIDAGGSIGKFEANKSKIDCVGPCLACVASLFVSSRSLAVCCVWLTFYLRSLLVAVAAKALTPALMRLFAPRPPIEAWPANKRIVRRRRRRRKQRTSTGLAEYTKLFETPDPGEARTLVLSAVVLFTSFFLSCFWLSSCSCGGARSATLHKKGNPTHKAKLHKHNSISTPQSTHKRECTTRAMK